MTMRYAAGAAILGLSLLPIGSAPAFASLASMTQPAVVADDTMVIDVAARRAAARGGVRVNRNVNVNRNVRVNRNINVNRAAVVNRGLYRGSYVYRGGPWVRPRNYWWPVGGAVAAGAALGMIAASSAAWAGPPPGPEYCWYFTDPSQRQGFWDLCP